MAAHECRGSTMGIWWMCEDHRAQHCRSSTYYASEGVVCVALRFVDSILRCDGMALAVCRRRAEGVQCSRPALREPNCVTTPVLCDDDDDT